VSGSVGQAALRLALFLIVASSLMLIWVPAGSAEFVIVVLTIGAGLLTLALAAALIRRGM
jgi:hypothetical protein